jgi:Polyketide cyclase / dehydrase and lipid transport
MARVVNQVTIHGPVATVFDEVTTTSSWPAWHPATIAVSGVTDRPIALGDTIHEKARIGGQEYEGDWTVVEYDRPSGLTMRVLGTATTITYAFVAEGPAATRFTRTLEFDAGQFAGSAADPAALERLMFAQSEAALTKLKALVEQRLSQTTA